MMIKTTFKYLLLIISLYVLLFKFVLAGETAKAVENNFLNKCQQKYKICTTEILDKVDYFYKTYENNTAECIKNIHNIIEAEYEYVSCQDQLTQCKGNNSFIFDKIHRTNDISLATGDPGNNGLNDLAVYKIQQQAKAISKLKSLLVSRGDKLIFEEYYASKGDPKPHHVWSITKSIMSLLVGIAIDNGYLESDEELIKSYFPDYFNKAHDSRKDDISIKHVLMMTTGINFTDNNNWYDWSSYEPYVRDDNARDWILHHEMLLNYQPGDIWLYGSPNTDLLSSIINTSTNLSTLEFAEKYLFEPLNINNYIWLHDSSENYFGGFTLFLRPRALMRIGLMVKNGGVYNNKRIVSEKWIEKSLANHSELGGEDGFAYGYLWWRFRVGNYQVISAFGYGGQQITLVPELNLTIVTTSDSHSACSKKSVENQFDAVLDVARTVILSIDKKK